MGICPRNSVDLCTQNAYTYTCLTTASVISAYRIVCVSAVNQRRELPAFGSFFFPRLCYSLIGPLFPFPAQSRTLLQGKGCDM